MLIKYSLKGFGGTKCTSDAPFRWTGLFDLLVLFLISTSGSFGHWIPRSPGSWASQACLAGAKKGRTERGRKTPIPGGGRRPRWSTLTGLVGPKCPFPFDKIVVPSTTLLYPAYKNNNHTCGGLGRVCATGMYRSIGLGHVKFPKFETGIFVDWKAP